jgi:hypothetical protein
VPDSYTFDASTVIQLGRFYPRNIFGGLWESVEALVIDGRGFIPKQVLIELERWADDLHPWAKGLPGFVEEACADEIACVAEISAAHPGWVMGEKNEADPWVVANAKHYDRLVVTEEKAKGAFTPDHNLRIPNVAAEHDRVCMNLFGLAEREGWTF